MSTPAMNREAQKHIRDLLRRHMPGLLNGSRFHYSAPGIKFWNISPTSSMTAKELETKVTAILKVHAPMVASMVKVTAGSITETCKIRVLYVRHIDATHIRVYPHLWPEGSKNLTHLPPAFEVLPVLKMDLVQMKNLLDNARTLGDYESAARTVAATLQNLSKNPPRPDIYVWQVIHDSSGEVINEGFSRDPSRGGPSKILPGFSVKVTPFYAGVRKHGR